MLLDRLRSDKLALTPALQELHREKVNRIQRRRGLIFIKSIAKVNRDFL